MIFPHPKDVKTQAEWDRRKKQQADKDAEWIAEETKKLKELHDKEQTLRLLNIKRQQNVLKNKENIILKELNEVSKKILYKKIYLFSVYAAYIVFAAWCIYKWKAEDIILTILSAFTIGVAISLPITFILVAMPLYIIKQMQLLHLREQQVGHRLNEIKSMQGHTFPETCIYLPPLPPLPYNADRAAFSVSFFSVILTTNSGQKFSIQCPNLEYAYDLRRLVEAAWRGSDVAVYHVDFRTQNIHMVVHANIKINNDIDQIMSRLEQLRVEDRTELKAYLDDVRLIANRNAISKEEVKETQTKLDRFLDKYRKIVGAANDTVELVNNIKNAFKPW